MNGDGWLDLVMEFAIPAMAKLVGVACYTDVVKGSHRPGRSACSTRWWTSWSSRASAAQGAPQAPASRKPAWSASS